MTSLVATSRSKKRLGYPRKNPKPYSNASSKPVPTKATSPRPLLRLRHHRSGRPASRPPLDRHRHYPPRHRPHQEAPLRCLRPRDQNQPTKSSANPPTTPGAAQLAEEDKYQFQWWALGQVGARPSRPEERRRPRHRRPPLLPRRRLRQIEADHLLRQSRRRHRLRRSATCAASSNAKKPRSASFSASRSPPNPCSKKPPKQASTNPPTATHLSTPANPHHPADSRRQTARIPAPPPRRHLQKSPAQPPRPRGKPYTAPAPLRLTAPAVKARPFRTIALKPPNPLIHQWPPLDNFSPNFADNFPRLSAYLFHKHSTRTRLRKRKTALPQSHLCVFADASHDEGRN